MKISRRGLGQGVAAAAGGTSPEAFEAFIRSEITKWAEVVRVSGATVD